MGFITPKDYWGPSGSTKMTTTKKKNLSSASSFIAKRGTIIGGDGYRNVMTESAGAIGYNYGPFGTKAYAREVPVDKRMMGGPNSYSALVERNRIAQRNQRMQQNMQVPEYMNPAKIAKQASAALGLGRAVSPGRELAARVRSYALEGQFGSATSGLKSTWEISDSMQVLGGQIPAADIARATSQNFGDKSLTNLPPNYYLGLGNQIKGPDKRYAQRLTELRKFGSLGYIERDTAYGQMAQLFKNIKGIREMNMRLRRGPMDHTEPDAPGEFQLGGMQGSRVAAWERRKLEKMQELEKKKLHRVGTGERFQQEATLTRQASDRGTV